MLHLSGENSMTYMTRKETEKFDNNKNNLDEPVKALEGYYYWYCPRCKKILDAEGGRFVNKCKNCSQIIDWSK